MTTDSLPEKPEYGEFQTVEWDDAAGFWLIRDLTDAEVAQKFDRPPDQITMRQLILGLSVDGWVTWDEADAWADRSALPAAVTTVINAMPEAERPGARITAKTMSVAERGNALLFGAAKAANPEMSDAEINALLADAFKKWVQL